MHQVKNKFIPLLLLIAAFSFTTASFGLSSDKYKRMTISASNVEINDKRGLSKYGGPVTVIQGSMRITARTVIVYHNKQRKIIRIVAYGRPARYKVRPDKEPYDLRSSANRLEYYPSKDLMHMFGNARVKQGPRDFRSNKISYNLSTNHVDAGKSRGKKANGQGRVNITIGPSKKEPKKDTKIKIIFKHFKFMV